MSKILNPHYSEPWADNGLIVYSGYIANTTNQEITIVTELRTLYACYIYFEEQVGITAPPAHGLYQHPLGWEWEQVSATGCYNINTIVPADCTLYYLITGTKEMTDVPHPEAQALAGVGLTGERRAYMANIKFRQAADGTTVTVIENNVPGLTLTGSTSGAGVYAITFNDSVLIASKWHATYGYEEPGVGLTVVHFPLIGRTSDTELSIANYGITGGDVAAVAAANYPAALHVHLTILPS